MADNEIMLEKAKELGRLLGQTDEYKALQRAREGISNDRDLTQWLNRLGELERELSASLQRGEQPPEEAREEYEDLFSKLQGSATYQAMVAAQTNFDKVVGRVNEAMGAGMESGAQSRIILPS